MVALWIPLAWLLTFFLLLGVPWIDRARHDSPHHCAERISNKQRFRYIFKLWPYTVPLFWVYAAEYLPLDGRFEPRNGSTTARVEDPIGLLGGHGLPGDRSDTTETLVQGLELHVSESRRREL